MTDSRIAALRAARTLLEEQGKEDHVYELSQLEEMFAPRKGDDPEEARARQLMKARCSNCGLDWPALAMPAPLSSTALTAQRFTQCPRCFSTEGIFVG